MNRLAVFLLAMPAFAGTPPVWFQSLENARPEAMEFGARTTHSRASIRSDGFRLSGGIELRFTNARHTRGSLDGPLFPVTRFGTSRKTRFERVGSGSAIFRGIYAGIDLRYRFREGDLEYDFILHPGARLDLVRIESTAPLQIEADGSVNLSNSSQSAPVAWEESDAGLRIVAVKYRACGNALCLESEARNSAASLTVDPVVRYATYFGTTSSDQLLSANSDRQGNLYLIGTSQGLVDDFPVWTVQPAEVKSPKKGERAGSFVVKFSPSGEILYAISMPDLYSVTLSAVDDRGELFFVAYVSGYGQLDPEEPAWFRKPQIYMLFKLNAAGNDVTYRTYVPGRPTAMVPDRHGNLFLAGTFIVPTTPGAFLTTSGPLSTQQIVKLAASGSGPLAVTYVENASDAVYAMALDREDQLVVAGTSQSTNLRTDGVLQRANNGVAAYRSTDQGNSWQPVSDPGFSLGIIQDRSDLRRLWRFTGNDLMVSDDFGNTWSFRASFDAGDIPLSLITVRHQPNWLYLTGLFKDTTVTPPSPPRLIPGLMRSNDGGYNWERASVGYGINGIEVDPSDPTRLVQIGQYNGSTYSTDAGRSWRQISIFVSLPPSTNPMTLFPDGAPGQALIISGASNSGPYNGAYRFDFDSKALTPVGGSYFSGVVDPAKPSRLLLLSLGQTAAVTLGITEDLGRTVTAVGTLPAGGYNGGFQSTITPDPRHEGGFYALTSTGYQYSSDFAKTWKALPGSVPIANSSRLLVDPQTGDLLLLKGQGTDGFVARFRPDLSDRYWSTYIGGNGDDSVTAVIPSADGYIIAGSTSSTNLSALYGNGEKLQGTADQFVMRISGDGSTNLGYRQFGRSSGDYTTSAFLDRDGNLALLGTNFANDAPVTDATLSKGLKRDVGTLSQTVTVLGPDFKTLYSSYVGGNGFDTFTLAMRPDGQLWLASTTTSTNLPVTSDAPVKRPLGYDDIYLMVFDWK